MLTTVKALCALNGVASWEDEVRSFLIREAAPHADDIRVDAMGNLIVFKKGKKTTGSKLMLCAHMDEVGVLIRSITEEGYLKFSCIGGIDRRVLLGKKLRIGPNGVRGIVGLKAYHLVSKEEEKHIPQLREFYIDIGAKDKEAAEALIEPGDVGAFDSDCIEFGDGLLKAKALDSRIGCAVMLKLLADDLPMDCTFVFTVQEVVGNRGAFGAAFSVEPEIALVLDGTGTGDMPSVAEHRSACCLGKGPVLSFMDHGTIYDRALFERLRELAEGNGIRWQLMHNTAGDSNASAVQRTKSGIRVCAISAPVRYPHTPAGIASVRDMDEILRLTARFLDDLAAQN